MPTTTEILLQRRKFMTDRMSKLNKEMMQTNASITEIDFLLSGLDLAVTDSIKPTTKKVAKKVAGKKTVRRKTAKKAVRRKAASKANGTGVHLKRERTFLWQLLVESGTEGLTATEARQHLKKSGAKGSASGTLSRWAKQGYATHESPKYYAASA